MGTEFWSRDLYLKKGINRRAKDIVCAILPPTLGDVKSLGKKIDIRGQWFTEHTLKMVSGEQFNRPTYPGAARTAAPMGWWDPIRKSRATDQRARSAGIDQNFVCFQGVQWHWNTKKDDWSEVTIKQGHFRPKVYAGCGQVRSGLMKYLETPSYLGHAGDN